jgi:methionyl-tRNA formyltransferase
MNLGAKLLLKTLQAVDQDLYVEVPQDLSKEAKHAPKIFKEDCEIDWNKSAQEIHNKVRGLNPLPTAFTNIDGKNVKIHSTKIYPEALHLNPGETCVFEKRLLVGTGSKPIEIIGLQMEGKKRSTALDFINAYQDLIASKKFMSSN